MSTNIERLEAALPMSVWALDLEIERQRPVTAAEIAVLRLLEAGAGDIGRITDLLGLGDTRLVERVLVHLLAQGAIETGEGGFLVTPTGQIWKAHGSALGREHVRHEIRHDPSTGAMEWLGHEHGVYSTHSTWTIELSPPPVDLPLRHKAEVGELLRNDGLPDEEDAAPRDRRGPVDLRGLAVSGTRVHWRAVDLEVHEGDRLVAFVGGAENPRVTTLLAGMRLDRHRRRVVSVD